MNRDFSGLTHYVESANIDSRLLKRAESTELKESLSKCSMKIRESIETSLSEGWWVPISFYNKKNGNGRIYNKQLWENVLENQRDTWEGSPMLCDHPDGDSDGSPDKICGVWLDGKMDEPNADGIGLVYGLLMPSGHLGDDLKDHLSKGLKVGTSSSGFGKLMSDGITVDPASYMIERLSDWVLNPSQGTFFSYQEDNDTIQNKSKNIRESNNTNNIKEKSMKDSKITKLEEKKFRRDMESFLESADKIADPQERLEEFREIKSYLEDGACPDLKEKIEQKIADEETFIKQALAEKMELKNELAIESPKDLKEKLTKIAEDVQLLDKESKDWKAIAEKLQKKYTESKKELESRHTNTFVEFQKQKIVSLEKELEAQSKKYAEIATKMTEAFKHLRSDFEENKALYENLENQNKNLEEKCNTLNESLEKVNKDKEYFEKTTVALHKDLENSKNLIEKLTNVAKSQREKIEESKESNDKLVETNNRRKEKVKELQKSLISSETKLKGYAKRDALKEKRELNSVDTYFESLYHTYGNDVLPYEARLRNCSTLSEAKTFFFKNVLGNLKETKTIDNMRLPENLTFSPEERESFIMNGKNSEKRSAIDRLPEGWF